jgi:hypothetical protein
MRTRHTRLVLCVHTGTPAAEEGRQRARWQAGRDGYRWQRMQTDEISQRKDNLSFMFDVVTVHDENVVVINMFSHVLVTLILCLLLLGCSAVECELYLAESTIPNGGLGIFSAIERNPGDVLGAGDVCLPLYDPKSHHDDTFNPFEDYVWLGEDMGMKMETESVVTAFCPVREAYEYLIASSIFFILANTLSLSGFGQRCQLQYGTCQFG